ADFLHNRVRKVSSSGVITTVAGGGSSSYYSGANATSVSLPSSPHYIDVDTANNIYFTAGFFVLKVTAGGIITTVAGDFSAGFSGDGGPASTARLYNPTGIATDRSGNIYICDLGNNRVRKVSAAGIITTIAGNGTAGYSGDGGAATAAKLSSPNDVVVDNSGNLLIADMGNSRIRKVTPSGNIFTIAGTGTAGHSGDGGPATAARLSTPMSVATGTHGNIYITDADGISYIRQIDTTGVISTICGNGSDPADGILADSAVISLPYGIDADTLGNIFFAEYAGFRIRKITLCTSPVVAPVTGAPTVCLGSSVTLASSTGGGLWSAVNGKTTVNTTGMVTGNITGRDTILYTVTNSCGSTIKPFYITVLPVPAAGATTGSSSLCIGVTAILVNSSSGGTWSSSNTAIATVADNGQITGLASGIVTITYTIANACGADTAFFTATVSTAPSTGIFTGTHHICTGATTILTHSTAGGIWKTTSPYITLDTTTGLVTALSAGLAVVTYTVTTGCGVAVAFDSISVTAFPTLSSSLTPPPVCSGSAFNYTPASAGVGTTFNWARASVAGVGNTADTGSSNINEALVNTTFVPVMVTYNIRLAYMSCASTEAVNVFIKPLPSLKNNASTAECSGRGFTLLPESNVAGTNFYWTRAMVNGISPDSANGYGTINETLINATALPLPVRYHFVLSAGGCTDTANIVIIVDHQSGAAPKITTRSPSWLCAQTMFQNFGTTAAADTNVKYEWSADNAEIFSTGKGHQYCLVNFTHVGTATIYLSAYTSSAHCPAADTFVVEVGSAANQYPVVTYFNKEFVCHTNTQTDYQWGYDDAVTLDSTILQYQTNENYSNDNPDFNGRYYWVITSREWCFQKTYFKQPLTVTESRAATISLDIFPNPAKDFFNIKMNTTVSETGTLTITNLLGENILQQALNTNEQVAIHLPLPHGLYFVSVSTANGRVTGKFTIAE
ncbi:MAG: T9SS type A sorting domain-containing protein, partial [Taibaiella sp.]|nr:T9SS type A sorting domain-containing protein [Taibaiella sp.]